MTDTGLTLKPTDLDPDDLGTDTADEHAELWYGLGTLIAVQGYSSHDPDAIRAVADWFDKLADHAQDLARELRDQALAICTACDGTGGWSSDDRDIECRSCDGSGRAA